MSYSRLAMSSEPVRRHTLPEIVALAVLTDERDASATIGARARFDRRIRPSEN